MQKQTGIKRGREFKIKSCRNEMIRKRGTRGIQDGNQNQKQKQKSNAQISKFIRKWESTQQFIKCKHIGTQLMFFCMDRSIHELTVDGLLI